MICCEVLEHLDEPHTALKALQKVVSNHIIMSVPREPLWRFLNLIRGKYILSAGNTPGHVQHWSRTAFLELVSQYFDVIEIRSPLPWVMVLCRSKR
jgi:2-polyprenyl-3-methyl-5-hydroxy-6-metoxy-1,4-benzoquinol methylase